MKQYVRQIRQIQASIDIVEKYYFVCVWGHVCVRAHSCVFICVWGMSACIQHVVIVIYTVNTDIHQYKNTHVLGKIQEFSDRKKSVMCAQ